VHLITDAEGTALALVVNVLTEENLDITYRVEHNDTGTKYIYI
jgi:hypothetical protein